MAKGGLSLQCLPRKVRHTISGEFYWDIDMVNAHPIILEHFCEKHKIPHQHLFKLNSNREEKLQEAVKEFSGISTRDEAKVLFLSMINGAVHKNIKWDFYNLLYEELLIIFDKVVHYRPDLLNYVKKQDGVLKDCNSYCLILSYLMIQ